MKLKNILLNNLGLKFLALILAFVTWLYVGEVTRQDSEMTVLQRLLLLSNYITKKVHVRPVFVRQVPDGYKFVMSKVEVAPEYILVAGPSKILAKKEFIYTMPIDLSEYTKSKKLEVGLERFSRLIRLPKTDVRVFVPIEKIEKRKKPEKKIE